MTKIPKKSEFQRSVRTFQAKTTSNKFLHVYFYNDKPSKKPVLLTSNDPETIKKCAENDNRPLSRILEEKERPVPVNRYNKFMGSVDVIDRILKKYSTAQKVGKRKDKTAWLKKTACYIFDLILLNVFSFHRIRFLEKNPQSKNLPHKFHRTFLLDLAKNLLPKEKTEIVLPPLHNPLLGLPLDGKENRNYQKRNGICDICEKGKKLRTRNRCSNCRKYICSKHQQKTVYFICTNCKPSK